VPVDPVVPPGVDGRRWHYRHFYGLADDGSPGQVGDGRPLLLVHGNCQAEALRVVLATSSEAFLTVRVPPVHELTAQDTEAMQRLLARIDVLLVQPVRDDYHGLPLGTAQVRAAAPQARVVLLPVVRDSRLHPYQGLVRVEGAGDPPVVPYHDLRTLALAASIDGLRSAAAPAGEVSVVADGVREVARRSQAELRRREELHGTLVVHDLLETAGAEASHTLNHPGNPVLVGLAQRALEALGLPEPARAPDRVLLRAVMSPLQADVLDALGLDVSHARTGWTVGGEPVDDSTVREAQLQWYADNPEVVRVGLERHGDVMTELRL